ncbi:MAG: glutamate mutase L [Bacillota bacterium]
MKIDCLVVEIGSTTTIINAFNIHPSPTFIGKGVSDTTVDTDVNNGLRKALENLKNNLNVEDIEYKEMFAASSAAGGLRVTVSGLVYDMTVKAAKEAALNAGANIKLINAGVLQEDDLERINEIKPNIIVVAGGTDYGEKNVAYQNLVKISSLNLNIPIIYAGNIENHYRINKYFSNSPQKQYLTIVDNVYPRVDYLNILPVRKVIYETFEKHIIHAKGMSHVKELVNQSIMPTPGSVMETTMILNEIFHNVMTIDVGGATTDIHSITEPSDEYKKYAEGESKEKRTVEGDLGVFINYENVLSYLDKKRFIEKYSISSETLETLIQNYTYMPLTQMEKLLVYELTKICVFKALDRHIGDYRKIYTSNGQKIIPEGRDLTQIQLIVLTGGPLIHLDNTEKIIEDYIRFNPHKLVPKNTVRIVKDTDYIMASLGVLSLKYKEAAIELLKDSLKL